LHELALRFGAFSEAFCTI